MHNVGYIKLLAYKENLNKKKFSWFNIHVISYLTLSTFRKNCLSPIVWNSGLSVWVKVVKNYNMPIVRNINRLSNSDNKLWNEILQRNFFPSCPCYNSNCQYLWTLTNASLMILSQTGSFLIFLWLIFIFDNFTHLCLEFCSSVIVQSL